MKNAELKTNRSKRAIVDRHIDIIMIYNVMSAVICCFSEEIITFLTTKPFYPSMYLIPIIVFTTLFINTIGSLSKPQLAFGEKMIYIVPFRKVKPSGYIFQMIFVTRLSGLMT